MKQILLIEDNEDHSELIIRSLEKGLGSVEVKCLDRSAPAFELLETQNFDLILSDYYLPDSKGEAHIKRLAKVAPDTPIIIITGQGDEKTAARSIQAGADDYIVKTREALRALPRILNRTITKHQSNLKKKQAEIRKQLQAQEAALQKVLGEVENLEKKIEHLQNLSTQKDGKSLIGTPLPSLENLINQVSNLKEFVQKMFTSGK